MAEEEDFTQLPLPDQFAHKNWKARKNGYETAAKEFRIAPPNAPILREFTDGQLWKAAVSDSNVAAQQEALSAYNAFLEASGPDGARKTRSHTVAGVVEKGLVGRPAAKAAAVEALLLLIELDKAEPVIEELLPFFSAKQPKVIAATLNAVTGIFHAYGCKVVEPKPVIKLLPKIYGHADKNVRAEGQNLTVELYRWLREAMKPLFWNELKEVQQKDLEKLFEPVKAEPAPKQERLLRSQQAAKEVAEEAAEGGEDGGDAGDDEGAIDLEPEYEAVDVFPKTPKDLSERLASTKWKDRKEVLDEVFTAVNVPAIQEGPFDDIIRGCAKSMKDANIMVVTVAANCVECIAKGLRKSFGKYRSVILEPMLERLKEKKQAVTDALGAACDAVFMATSLGDIQTNVLEAMKNKNPQIKEHSAKFMSRSLKTTKTAPTPEQMKEIAEGAKKLLTESAPNLRDAGAEILGVLRKIMGDRNMLAHLEGLDDIRKNKIKEFSDAAEVKAKWKPKAAPAPKAAPPGKRPAGPPAKKPAPGGPTKKAPAPRAATPPPVEEAPLQPKPTSRPGAKPGAGLRPPGAGLKPPAAGLAKPGSSLKAPQSSTASPKRQGMIIEEPPQIDPPKSGIAAPGRGLAGRPLGKPAAPPTSPPPTQRAESASSALSSIERQELSELRQTVELLQQQTSDLRNDKMKLTSQITELQNQNAQLIEDHTRDVLQIKAKETQLVRARSDAEASEDRVNSLSKEIDRLKREMNRLGRQRPTSEMPQPTSDYLANGNGDGTASSYGTPTSRSTAPGAAPYSGNRHSTYNPVPSARAYSGRGGDAADNFATGEGKENFPDLLLHNNNNDVGGKLSRTPSAAVERPNSSFASHHQHHQSHSGYNNYNSNNHHSNNNAFASRTLSNGSSGRATPASASGDSEGFGGAARSSQEGGAGGVESWRRAAEVTQNLKARIEMMKARQNVGRGQ